MKSRQLSHRYSILGLAGAACFAITGSAIAADDPAAAQPNDELSEVVVTGFRASLQSSVAAKRDNISISDSIYAEDIGKFPDLNLAESLQRIPGVQIARDVTGEGTSVAVRGLGRDFTQITLNGAPVETASDSNIDGFSQGRGIDLVLFPTELFRQLTVTKTPTAKQVEGAVAANIDLRIARPFDNKGFHINYAAKGSYQESAEQWSPRLGLYASNTWDVGGGEFGILGGVAYSNRKYRSDGFNTIGYTTVGLGTRCAFATDPLCNSFHNPNDSTGYGNSNQAWPTTVPVGYNFGANGANAGDPLTVCGANGQAGGTSGLSCRDLSFAIWPRLARPETVVGERETQSGILSMQWAPSENLSFYVDGLYSKADHTYERNVLNLAVRSTNTNVPVNVKLDENHVVTSATLANPQWLNENRPYQEDTEFLNVSLGMDWTLAEKLKLSPSFNYNHSDFFRSTNTYLFNSVLNSGITVDIEGTRDGVIRVAPSQNLNDTTRWVWNAMRIQPVQRDVWQKGGRLDAEYDFADAFKLGVGYSRDKFHREITNWEVTSCATDGGNTSSRAGLECTAALTAAGIQNAKVAIPNAQLSQYMRLWTHGEMYSTSDFDVGLNNGWALPNYRALDPVTNIKWFEQELGVHNIGGIYVNGYSPRVLDEQTDAQYVEANGQLEMLGKLRYNVGVRRIDTDQFLSGYVNVNTPSGQERQLQTSATSYDKYLPSFNLASDLGHGLVLRAAAAKTMTRPQPGDIAPNEALSVTGDVLTKGNPNLSPYYAKNYDLGLEWYFGDSGLGVVALSGWQKKIEGYTSIISTQTPFGQLGIDYSTLPKATRDGLQAAADARCGCAGNPLDALVRVDQRQNTSELITLDGIEVTYVQPLDFLLKGAGFSVNYTHIKQKSTGGLPNAPSSAITGLSPYTYNVTTFYEDRGFSGRLTWSVRDAYVDFLGNNENNIAGDNYAQKRSYLDAAFSYKLPMETDLSISLELQNLTNQQLLTYFRDDPQTPRNSFAPGRQVLLGVVGKF